MRAARYYGKEDVRIEHDVPAPPEQLMEGQVRVQPAFVGICGTGMLMPKVSQHTSQHY
jgi:threonine dehydrogenase-like Zn-dependent dehydrogenase